MCSATDMRCAINDDHVRVVQLTSSSYCFLDNLSRTLSRILLNKRTTGLHGLSIDPARVRLGAVTRLSVVVFPCVGVCVGTQSARTECAVWPRRTRVVLVAKIYTTHFFSI